MIVSLQRYSLYFLRSRSVRGAQKDGVTEWFIAAFRLESVMTPLARRPRFGVDKRTTRMAIAFAHGVRFTKMTQ